MVYRLTGGYFEDIITFEQILKLIQQQKIPEFEPGTQFQYSATNYTLLAEIVKRVTIGDLVITSDIPLAAEVIEKGGHALNPRGELYTPDNIRARLNIRDFMDTMRASGINTGGPPPLGQGEKQSFANELDKLLAKRKKD